MALRWLTLLAAFVVPSALACSPVRSIDVLFDRNSAKVPAEQVLRLAHWTATLRLDYPRHDSLSLGASAEAGERNATELAWQRARAVTRVIDDLQFTAAKLHPPERVYVVKPGAYGAGQEVKRVEIDFLPACTHECPCQKQRDED
jgi:hypothetical protein